MTPGAGESKGKGKQRKLCGAKTRGGGKCRRPAGWGTSHPGRGRCKLHGGATPAHERAAQREAAREAVELYGLPREIDPHQALLEEVQRTAGHVAWLDQEIRQLRREQLTHGISKTTVYPPGREYGAGGREVEITAAPNVLLQLYWNERDRLIKVCKAAIDAGVAERQVRLAEMQAKVLVDVIRGLLEKLGHDPSDPKVREVVREQLMQGQELIEGSGAEEAIAA